MDKIRKSLRKSYFVVNKIYLFLIFLLLAIEDISLGFYYFLISSFIYLLKVFRSKVPIEVDREFEVKTFVYKKTVNKELKLDLYLPYKAGNKNPLVFFCHGGGWISGFRNQPNNVSWCKFLASKGLAVVSIDYRYGYKNTMEDILSDYTDALNYVKANHNQLSIDKDRIVLMGLSAGGHLSLLYSTYHTNKMNEKEMEGIKGVVAYYPPTNLNHIFTSENKSIFAKFAAMQTLKGRPVDNKAIYDYYSPITWVSPNMIPCLIVHGKLDNVVPFNSSSMFVKALKDNKVKHIFLVHKKGGHSFDTRFKDMGTVTILERTVGFIRKAVNM